MSSQTQKDIVQLFGHITQLSEGTVAIVDRIEQVIADFNKNFEQISKQALTWDNRTRELKVSLEKAEATIELLVAAQLTQPAAQRPPDEAIIAYMEEHGVSWDVAIRRIMEAKSD